MTSSPQTVGEGGVTRGEGDQVRRPGLGPRKDQGRSDWGGKKPKKGHRTEARKEKELKPGRSWKSKSWEGRAGRNFGGEQLEVERNRGGRSSHQRQNS